MSKWTLNIEGVSKTIPEPSWEDIKQALKQLNGREHTQLDIVLGDNQLSLIVCGGEFINGKRRYAVQFYMAKGNEDAFGLLLNPNGDPEILHTLNVEEVGTDFTDNQLVEYGDAEYVLRYVFEIKTLPNDRNWD